MKIAGYDVHPAAELFPMMPADELAELSQDIAAHGLLHDVMLLDGRILDGRNRAKACKIASIPIRVKEWKGKGSPIDFVISANARRRHLTEQQRIILAAKAMALFEAEAAERSRANLRKGSTAPSGSQEPLGRARDRAAAAFNVGGSSVQRGKTLLDKAPELADKVLAGDLKSVKAAEAQIRGEEQDRACRDYVAPEGKFGLIYDDPSWPFERDQGDETHRGAAPYPKELIDKIANEPMPADDDCVLAMWTTKQHFLDGSALHVVRARGFEARNFFVWGKTTQDGTKIHMGVGNWGQNCEEILIIATRGRPHVDFDGQPTLILHPRLRDHSRKPDAFREMLERCVPCNAKVELHAREDEREGWTLAGAERGKFKAAG